MSREKILYQLGLFCARHKWTTLFLMIAATAIMGVFAAQIKMNLGMLSLLEDDDPEVKRVHYANENFGGMDYTFITVTADSIYDAKKFADRLSEELTADEMVLRVVHKVEIDELMKYGLMFAEPQQINDFAEYLAENNQNLAAMFSDTRTEPFLTGFNGMIERQLSENESESLEDEKKALDLLDSFDNFMAVMKQYLELGPEVGHYQIKKSLRRLFINDISSGVDVLDDEYMLSLDGKKLLLLVMPSEAGDDMVFTDRFMAMVARISDPLAAEYAGASYQVAGNVAIMSDEYHAIRWDTRISTLITMVLVLLIFYFFFRKFSDLFLILISLVAAIIWTYGITFMHIGYLGITTAFFSAILIGLGVDFAIHLIARYSEYRREGRPVEESIAEAMGQSGPGIFTGAVTTSAAFLVLITCRFQGISQLGFVAGAGILAAAFIMFTMLPAMIAVRDSFGSSSVADQSMRQLNFLADIASFMVRHRNVAMVLIILGTIGLGYAASLITFNYDFRSLEPVGSKGMEANHQMQEDFGRSVDYGLVFADSVEQSRELAAKLTEKVSFTEIKDISQYLPLGQAEKKPLIAKTDPLLKDIAVTRRPEDDRKFETGDLRKLAFAIRESARMVLAVKQLAILGGYFEVEDRSTEVMANFHQLADMLDAAPGKYLANAASYERTLAVELETLLNSLKEASHGEELTVEKLPQIIRDNFIGLDGKFMIYAYPGDYIWTKEKLEQIQDDLRSVSSESTSIGLVFLQLIMKIKQDFSFAVWLSVAAVFLIMILDFRRLITSFAAMLPLIVGAVWMVGTMVLFGLTFNVVNVVVVPLIIGIGIDDGVHLVHRYRSESGDRISNSILHTGRAIFLTSITTMAGFGSLGIASYTAIASLGWVLLIGVFYCLFTSIVVLPVILSYLESSKTQI